MTAVALPEHYHSERDIVYVFLATLWRPRSKSLEIIHS